MGIGFHCCRTDSLESKMTCKCRNVSLYDKVWQCVLCGREFFPVDQVTEADEQLPVEEPDDEVATAVEED